MAQRTIHYLFGEILSNHIEINNKQRFLLGNVLPDAIEINNRNKSHFRIETNDSIYFDFEAFRNDYDDLILKDDLYLGYYMHLVVDAFYRQYIYQEHFKMPKTFEEVKVLHHDYHILNSYIVNKYKLNNILEKNIHLEKPINEITTFITNEFLDEMENDFNEQTNGIPHYLTENMIDEFIEIYVPLAIKEIINIKQSKSTLKCKDYAWSNKKDVQ